MFSFLSQFHKILESIGFASLDDVPVAVLPERSTDLEAQQLQNDISLFLKTTAKQARCTAPFIRSILQLTGYDGSNTHKFKPVEDATADRYAGTLYSALALSKMALSWKGKASIFSDGDAKSLGAYFNAYEKYRAADRRDAGIQQAICQSLCALFSFLLLACFPDQTSTWCMPFVRVLAMMCVRAEGKTRRFNTAEEMSQPLAAIICCMSCTSLYRIRQSGEELGPIQDALSLKKNTVYAFVRDVMDKTCGDRRASTAPIRFSTCIDPEHNCTTHEDDACGVLDDVHLSLGTVRQTLWRIEVSMKRILEQDILLTFPMDIDKHGHALRGQLSEKMSDGRPGIFFGNLSKNVPRSAASGCAILLHILEGHVRGSAFRFMGNAIPVAEKLSNLFFVKEADKDG